MYGGDWNNQFCVVVVYFILPMKKTMLHRGLFFVRIIAHAF
jgi:hypothetical protein